MTLRFLLVALFLWVPLSAQQTVDRRNMYERVWAVVPMIGSGTADDPLRPDYIPAPPPPGTPPSTDGIIGFTMVLSDDGKHALVQFVAKDRKAFKGLLADTRVDVKVFEKGKAKRQDIETAFQTFKKDFNLDQMGASLPRERSGLQSSFFRRRYSSALTSII